MNASLFLLASEATRLRPYQRAAVDSVRSRLPEGASRLILQLPTGAGKTRIAAELIGDYAKAGARVTFVVPRISLIEQTVAAFEREGIDSIGVIQGRHFRTDSGALVQVASAQTLSRRNIPRADLVIVDEAHLQFTGINDWMADPAWADVPFIGLSATPWARGMGKQWRELIRPTSITEMIEAGFLSNLAVFAPPPPDLSEVRTTAGEFNEADLSAAGDKTELVADVVKTWFKRADGLPTLVYGVDRAHARHLCERFIEVGVKAEYVDCDTPLFEREEVFQRFRSGSTAVICNVATLDTGIDLPNVACIVDARPTKSRIRFVQTIGRGLRIAVGKDRLLVLDHAGNTQRLGLVTDVNTDVTALDDGEAKRNFDRSSQKNPTDPKIRLCPECRTVLPPRPILVCAESGHTFPTVTLVRERKGELVEFGSGRRGGKGEPVDTVLWHGALTRIAREKGYQHGWIKHQYRKKFGTWPPMFPPPEREPTVEIRNWVRAQQISFAKARSHVGKNQIPLGRSKHEGYIKTPHYLFDCFAWTQLSVNAKCAWHEITRVYNGSNNKRLAMGARALGDKLNISRNTAWRALQELTTYGFIEVTKSSTFAKKRLSNEYRLTHLRCDLTGALPSKPFMKIQMHSPTHETHSPTTLPS